MYFYVADDDIFLFCGTAQSALSLAEVLYAVYDLRAKITLLLKLEPPFSHTWWLWVFACFFCLFLFNNFHGHLTENKNCITRSLRQPRIIKRQLTSGRHNRGYHKKAENRLFLSKELHHNSILLYTGQLMFLDRLDSGTIIPFPSSRCKNWTWQGLRG